MEAVAQNLVSVIVVNYNGGAYLNRCVGSLLTQTHANFEAFIVDNASTDGSMDALPALDDRFTIIRNNKNLGFAAANNLAAKQAKGNWIGLLNPDAFARADWIEKALIETQGDNVTMVGSLQFMADDPDTLDGAGDFYHASGLAWRAGFGHPTSHAPEASFPAFAPCGAGAFYHRETFLSLGGFDERFFCYFEDVDMGYRMRLAGGQCVQSVHAKIDHVSSGITGRASDFAVYHGTRNRLWCFFKNTPLALFPLLLPLHIAMSFFIVFWAGLRSGRFTPTARGLKDGFIGLPAIWRSRKTVRRDIALAGVLRMMTWSPQPVRARAIPAYNLTSPDP